MRRMLLLQYIHAQQKQFTNQIRNRQHLKVDTYQLLQQPHQNIHQHSPQQNKCLCRGSQPLLCRCLGNHRNHRAEISQQINQIQPMPRPIYLAQHRNTVDGVDRYRLIINIQYARAGSYRKYPAADGQQHPRQKAMMPDTAGLQNNHQHSKRQKHRAQIAEPVGPQCSSHTIRHSQQQIPRIYHHHRYKQQHKPACLLPNEHTISRQQQHSQQSRRPVYYQQTHRLFTNFGTASGGQQHCPADRYVYILFHKYFLQLALCNPTLFPTLLHIKKPIPPQINTPWVGHFAGKTSIITLQA